jgi:hypothetical protein
LSERGSLDERVWESGWEAHELNQRRRLSTLTFAEKLSWLEGAHEMVQTLDAQRRARATEDHRGSV